jgi:hypothetical protein
MTMGVVMLPAPRTLGRISISAVTVTELVIEEPPCYPVRAVSSGSSEIPGPLSLRVPALGYACHSFIFRPLLDVTPIVGRLSLAILFEVVFLRR